MDYIATIGLEAHAELKTKTKMFCGCKNDSDEKRPNVNVCAICTGHPGTLPVINEEAIQLVQRVGLALGGEVQKKSRFDRKNYFYPDLPKGYQISQYQNPLVWKGMLKGVRITRVHLEEDTARSTHNVQTNSTLIDFNRSGVPLMELVTEPDLMNAQDTRAFAEELQLILQYIGASEANMEKGEMRCEANISVRPIMQKEYGTKVEIKNLNSFRSVERAIDFEIKRQIKTLEKGERIIQETRGWDENKEKTFLQRSKESAHDYRYFPEPDLPPLEFSDSYIEKLRAMIPELPVAKRKRFTEEYGISEELTETLIREWEFGSFWEHVVSELKEWLPEKSKEKEAIKLAANYFTSDLLGLIKEKNCTTSDLHMEPKNFAELMKMIVEEEVSSRAAKDILRHMIERGGDPSSIVEVQGLRQVSDVAELEEIIKKVLHKSPAAISDYRNGKQNALQFLVGQVVKETKGAANPAVIRELLTKHL